MQTRGTRVLWLGLVTFAATLAAAACGSSSSGPSNTATDAGAPDTFASAPDTSNAPACAADLTKDPKNCGKCARDCGAGSACLASRCAPVELGSAPAPVTALTSGFTRVYWEAGGVFGCTKTGCGGAPETLLAAPLANGGIESTTLGDELIYFTISGANGHVGRCNPGGTCSDDHVTTALSNPSRIIATTTDLFFATDLSAADAGGPDGGADSSGADGGDAGDGGMILPGGAVLRAALGGSAQSPVRVSGAEHVLGFAFAGGTLMWTDRTAGVTLCKLPCADPAPLAKVGTGVDAAPSGRPSISAGVAFWPTVEGAIVRCSPMSCASTRELFLAPSPDRVVGDVASDGSTLYFSLLTTTKTTAPSQPSGQIASCAIAAQTCTPEIVATNLPTPNRLAIDGSALYWANGSDSTDGQFKALPGAAVFRVAR